MKDTKGVYFLRAEISNFRCFGEDCVLDLSDGDGNWKKWTVILGDNGTGKTSLLKLLAAFNMEAKVDTDDGSTYYDSADSFWGGDTAAYFSEKGIGTILVGVNIYVREDGSFSEYLNGEVSNEGFESVQVFTDKRLAELKCYGYGANRFMSLNSLSYNSSYNSLTLFDDDAKLINAEEWQLQLDYAASKESDVQEFATKKRDKVKDILLEILPDIDELRFSTPTKENLKSTVEFHTPYGWVTIHQLSLGYKTMVAWMVDLAARLFERYPDSDNPLAEPAIVLIDEIDLHLHPKWQRKIFKYLDELFPATQFIVTAHSPLVVQSAPSDANIVLLRREGNTVVIDQDIQSVNNWRLDQILTSDLFGFESARGPEAEDKLKRRTELIQKDKLDKAEQAELDKLSEFAFDLPTAENEKDNDVMSILREAAKEYQKKK